MESSDVRQKVFRIPDNIIISVGLTWSFLGVSPVDLDISATCFTKEGQFLDVVFFNHLFPIGTNAEVLRSQLLVDPEELPYVFLSGDSTLGGEEDNQMPGIALAARRPRAFGQERPDAEESVFDRHYQEEELNDVQRAIDEAGGHGEVQYDASGALIAVGAARRELCDEVLTFVMPKIPKETEVIFISVTSYTGADLAVLPKVRLVLYNETTGERVGAIPLRSSGRNTAVLAAMLIRAPSADAADGEQYNAVSQAVGDTTLLAEPAPAYWDLREMNINTFGYTFVDLLPVMLGVLGVNRNSRADALQSLPNYSLAKREAEAAAAKQPLCDVRFGAGWSGDHDLDTFFLMLDENNNYVDHLFPKERRRLTVPDLAQLSGDALSGGNTPGDEEFIDFVTYRVPPEVRTIAVGVSYQESFGPHARESRSIFEIPDLYVRLQNRTLSHPYSVEVDRWDVSAGAGGAEVSLPDTGAGGAEDVDAAAEEAEKRREANARGGAQQKPTHATYKAPDGSTQPVRTLLLGLLAKVGSMPSSALFPNGRRLDQYFFDGDEIHSRSESPESGAGLPRSAGATATEREAELQDEVPRFTYVPIHRSMPVDVRLGFAPAVVFLQCVAAIFWGKSGAGSAAPTAAAQGDLEEQRSRVPDHSHDGVERSNYVLDTTNNLVWWEQPRNTAVGGLGGMTASFEDMWAEAQQSGEVTAQFAVEVQFLEVTQLQPQLPDRFKCHAEAWVYCQNHVPPRGGGAAALSQQQHYRTPYLVHRDRLRWDANNAATSVVFVVHKYDRIRVLVYEHAAFGFTDINLMDMQELWGDVEGGDGVVQTRTLQGGGHLSRVELRLRLRRVPLTPALHKLKRDASRRNARYAKVREEHAQREDKRSNQNFNPCALM